jgi:lysyl-tRNA synthetase class I
MTKKQINRLTMYKAVRALFDHSSTEKKQMLPLKETYAEFSALVNQIEKLGLTQQERVTMGHTADKNLKRNQTAAVAYSVALKLRALAKVTKNQVLMQAVDYSQSELQQQAEENLLNTYQIIHDYGLEYKTQAEAYKLTDELLKRLQTAINESKPLSANRDTVGDQRIVATAALVDLFKQASSQLSILDDLVEGDEENSSFAAAYFQAREIFDRRNRKGRVDPEDTE